MRTPTRLAFVVAAVCGSGATVHAQARDEATSARGEGFVLEGVARVSSTGEPREPTYVLRNLSDRARHVVIVALEWLGDGDAAAPLAVRSAGELLVAPRAAQTLALDYGGQLTPLGPGLPRHRYRLRITVDGAPLAAVATTSYVCRIPRRPAP